MRKVWTVVWVLTVLFAREACGFELETRIYPADSLAKLRFRAVDEWDKKNFDKVKVGYIRDDRRFTDGEVMRLSRPRFEYPKMVKHDGVITVEVPLRGEHEHIFCFELPYRKGMKRLERRYLSVYSLAPDLFELRPFKGEFHQHSKFSPDGKEPAEQHIRYARAVGLDFVAVTDHYNYDQNQVAISTARDSGSGLTVYPGEEMHTFGSLLHAICLGAPRKMSQIQRTPEFSSEVRPVLEELRRELPEVHDSERLGLAEALTLARQARSLGAVVIYSHPHWRFLGTFNAPPSYTRYILTHDDFDAVEIVNGQFNAPGDPNFLTAALLHDILAETGKRWPVVSASDEHKVSRDKYRRNYNVLFAPNCSFDEFRKALKEHRVVACVDAGMWDLKALRPIYFGTWRLAKLAAFLHDSGYWQRHDKVAAEQAELIAKYLEGDKSVVPKIRELARRIDGIREKFYASPGDDARPLGGSNAPK